MVENFKEILLDLPWGKLSVVCCGDDDGEPILMVHGSQDSAATFFLLIKYFPKKFRLYMLELPGCGKSTNFPTGQPIHFFEFIPLLKLATEKLKLDKFIFIGHSMGFHTCLFYNVIYPGQITKMIAIDSVAQIPVEPDYFPMYFSIYEMFFNDYNKYNSGPQNNPSYTYKEALDAIMKKRKLNKQAGETVLKRALISTEDGLYKFCWDQRWKIFVIPMLSSEHQAKILGNINVPHLTILASESVTNKIRHTSGKLIEKFSENPDFRLAIVEGNHDVHLNSPEIVAQHIVPFLLHDFPSRKETDECIAHLKFFKSRAKL